MGDNELREEYKRLFDDIKASEELRSSVLSAKAKRRDIRPAAAAFGAAAAAVIVFAAVRGYDFSRRDDGVISETVVTQTQRPRAASENAASASRPQASPPAERFGAGGKAAPERKAAGERGDKTSGGIDGKETSEPRAAAQSGAARQSLPAPTAEPEPDLGAGVGANAGSVGESRGTEETEEEIREEIKEEIEETPEEGGEGTLVLPLASGTVILRMNSPSLLETSAGGSAESAALREAPEDAEYRAELWDNEKYFGYLGKDIINVLKLSGDMSYIGDTESLFLVGADGKPKNDTRIFAFEGAGGRFVSVLTTLDTSLVDTILSSEEVEKCAVEDAETAAFRADETYSFYMRSGAAAYVVTAEGLDGAELAGLIVSLAEN